MRERLSWDKEKTAEIMKQADPYTMNQTRTNPPASKYDVGGPSQFGEDQHTATPWKTDGRTETGHPAPAREAVVQARKLEDKALKCITIAQRMLPGADETVVEDQATDFMFLPERSIQATLQRQTELAAKIAAECKTEKDPKDPKDPDEPVNAKAAPVIDPEKAEKKNPDEPVNAKAAPVIDPEKAEKKNPDEPVDAKAEKGVNPFAPKDPDDPAAAAKDAPKDPKEASDKDLLDVLFDSAEIVPQPKTGAKTLSGLVKQASTSDDPLTGLWETPPDISSVFGKNR
jgi:hypothetical protein